MKTDLLYLYNAVKENTSFQEFMEATPYDELFEIDLLHDTFKTVYHMEGKYLLPVSEGSFRKFILYIAEKAVHPEDREKFLRFYDLPAVTEMLTASPLGIPHKDAGRDLALGRADHRGRKCSRAPGRGDPLLHRRYPEL